MDCSLIFTTTPPWNLFNYDHHRVRNFLSSALDNVGVVCLYLPEKWKTGSTPSSETKCVAIHPRGGVRIFLDQPWRVCYSIICHTRQTRQLTKITSKMLIMQCVSCFVQDREHLRRLTVICMLVIETLWIWTWIFHPLAIACSLTDTSKLYTDYVMMKVRNGSTWSVKKNKKEYNGLGYCLSIFFVRWHLVNGIQTHQFIWDSCFCFFVFKVDTNS